MRSAASFVSGLSRRGPRILGGLVAAVVLMPVPAMALTFTSSWQDAVLTSGGPTPAAPTFTDTTTGPDDSLSVNMGNYQGQTKTAISTIGLERTFTVPNAGEAVSFAEQFATQFKQGGVALTIAVFDNKGHLVADPISYSNSTKATAFTTISANQSAVQSLKSGSYYLTVGMVYNTNNKIGGWKTISQHHFQIDGL